LMNVGMFASTTLIRIIVSKKSITDHIYYDQVRSYIL
jgi:hypothetical protein